MAGHRFQAIAYNSSRARCAAQLFCLHSHPMALQQRGLFFQLYDYLWGFDHRATHLGFLEGSARGVVLLLPVYPPAFSQR